jgi:hypothetical protein
MAKPNYSGEKRRKELEKQRKKEEKKRRKIENGARGEPVRHGQGEALAGGRLSGSEAVNASTPATDERSTESDEPARVEPQD